MCATVFVANDMHPLGWRGRDPSNAMDIVWRIRLFFFLFFEGNPHACRSCAIVLGSVWSPHLGTGRGMRIGRGRERVALLTALCKCALKEIFIDICFCLFVGTELVRLYMCIAWFPVATLVGVNRVLIFIHFPPILLGLGLGCTRIGLRLKVRAQHTQKWSLWRFNALMNYLFF